MAGVGEHSLTYTFVIEATSCVGYDTTTIIVNALPEIEIESLTMFAKMLNPLF